jgi:hypothetical protein
MKIALPLCCLLLAVSTARAQEDPLKSAACGAALASLQSARAAEAPRASVDSLRQAAASACLGSATPPVRPGRVTQAPIVVPPPQIELAPRAAPPAGPSPPAPPLAIERAPLPATCDANGCWSNGGTHLRHIPPTLVGPGGACTQAGGFVYCP